MTAHIQPSTYEAQLREAYKARQARFAAACRNVRQAPDIVRAPPYRPFMAKKIPLWTVEEIFFDAHVTSYDRHRLETANAGPSPMRAYIQRRCEEMGVSYREVISRSRKYRVAEVRQLLMWEIRTSVKPSMSLPEIGRLFGGKDHSTVIHAIRRVEAKKARGE